MWQRLDLLAREQVRTAELALSVSPVVSDKPAYSQSSGVAGITRQLQAYLLQQSAQA